jgi:hypothetical protein
LQFFNIFRVKYDEEKLQLIWKKALVFGDQDGWKQHEKVFLFDMWKISASL